jgi:hypothetical protein
VYLKLCQLNDPKPSQDRIGMIDTPHAVSAELKRAHTHSARLILCVFSLCALALCAVSVVGEACAQTPPPADPTQRPHTDDTWTGDRDLGGQARSTLAFSNKEAEVKALFTAAGLSFPPKEMLWRVFKEELVLEVWASDTGKGPHTLVATYQICRGSGIPGPKRQEGDLQVPEGFYTIDYFNNTSAYYLSMRISYPNSSDAILGRRPLGDSIMVHGDCVSIGCVAMSDERIQELWVMARRMNRSDRVVQAHLFPGRDLDKFIAQASKDGDATLETFWTNIKEGLVMFETSRKLPIVGVNRRTGAYTFR